MNTHFNRHEGVSRLEEAEWSREPLYELTQLLDARDYLDYLTERSVKKARLEGRASWQQIADALGVTRQTAWRKYAHTLD